MADIKARLLEAIGGFKVPQHKKEGLNEFEITEGKDGKMNVRDTDVHARLDAIEQKLNGTLETQLTGSNLKKMEQQDLMIDILVPANSFYNLSDVITKLKTPSLAFSLELDVAVECRVYLYPKTNTNRTLIKGGARTIFDLDGSKDNGEDLVQVLHENNIIYFQNRSDTDVLVKTLTMTQHFI